MPRTLTSASSLENLKGEAKRWLKALRAHEPEAVARFRQYHPNPPTDPGLRDVQLAVARACGFPGWTALKAELARRAAAPGAGPDPLQQLLGAANRGDPAACAGILAGEPELLNQSGILPGHTGRRTALHFAMNSMEEGVIDLLLERGADPNLRDEGDNATPLHFAAEKGKLSVVRRLIEHGADPIGDGDLHELTIIGWSVCFDYAYHPEVAEYLLAHGARHTIFSATAMGAIDLIREIAARAPADLDRRMDRTNRHRTPLHLAIVKNQPSALATLLALGANPEIEDQAGLTPLDQAALHGRRGMAEALLQAGAKLRLPAAVALDRDADLQRLLAESPETLRPGGRWDRLIIRASERGSARTIETLIGAGASVHVRDDYRTAVDSTHGYTALHAAAFHGNVEAARVLLAHGANPSDRDDKYWGSPAGWAFFAKHEAVGRMILQGPIDLFDAVGYDRIDRIPEILKRDPFALERRFGEYVNGDPKPREWVDPAWTPIFFAIAEGKAEAVVGLLDAGASLAGWDAQGRTPIDLAAERRQPELVRLLERRPPRGRIAALPEIDQHVADFLQWACLDWRVGGAWRARRNRDADRLLATHPEIATANLVTAVVSGETARVHALLAETPGAASAIGGPRSWPPLLYLTAARLESKKAQRESVTIARLLLDHGADPNVFYLGGNADIHYTALTAVLGRGEELGAMHPRAKELTELLLERGASPHDNQVLYNVFADNTSRHLLTDDIVWLLELLYRSSIRRGCQADWTNPEWPMFDMKGAPSLGDEHKRKSGARFLLEAAIDRNLLRMAEWLLAHGAGPNTTSGNVWKQDANLSLYQLAVRKGHREMADLLARFGARRETVPVGEEGRFVEACLSLDENEVRDALSRHPGYLSSSRALFAAVNQGRTDVLQFLLDLGVSPDVEGPEYPGQRALHLAAAKDEVDSARLLLARGAEADPRDSRHQGTPLGWAAWFGNERVIKVLAPHSRDLWPLVHTGQSRRIGELLEADPTVARSTSESGETLLMWLPEDDAAAVEVARGLMARGADPGARTPQGLTAADIADRRGLVAAAAFLRKAASDRPPGS